MKTLLATIALTFAAAPSMAEIIRVESATNVSETADALEAAVEGAGARIFARVDHGAGAASIGSDIGASQLLIFGNPQIGTPAMQSDPLAGLYLPLKVLVYEDAEGKTWLAYETPADMFEGLQISADAEFLAKMTGALGNLTAAAAGN